MGFRQYTSCTAPNKYVDAGFAYSGWVVGVTAAVTAAVAALDGMKFWMGLGYVAIVVLLGLISLLYWWLNGRLICLGGERCLIGVVMGPASVQPFSKAGDDDASINVVLAPSPVDTNGSLTLNDALAGHPKEDYWANPVQGALITPQPAVLNIGRGYVQLASKEFHNKSIHCEFEGSGIQDLLDWAGVVLALVIAAMIIYTYPGLGWLAQLLAWIAVGISALAGGVGLFHPPSPGDPHDVDPNMARLQRGRVVVIRGDWVYDSLHEGWNEIHAIHACQIIAEMSETTVWPTLPGGISLNDPGGVKAAVAQWRDAMFQAQGAEDGGNRDDPAQNWVLHPLIDGCNSTVIV